MANRYPLIIDATNKKLKELPIGDNLRVDGDIVISNGNITINGNPLNETIFINYNQINNPPVIPADIDELADINNILSTRDLVGASIFSADSTLLIDGINGTISYDILVDTPFIPNDISQLSDVQGLLGDGSTIAGGASAFLDLNDTPNVYSFGANRFVKVNNNETALEFGEVDENDIQLALGYTPYNGDGNPLGFINNVEDALGYVPYDANNPLGFISEISSGDVENALGYTPYDGVGNPFGFINNITDALGYVPYDGSDNPLGFISSIDSNDVETALGYTPYDGSSNPFGFISDETDTLQSVVTRGNNTNLSISVNGLQTSSVVSGNATIQSFLDFFDNNETNQFEITVESGKILLIANRLSINTNTNQVTVIDSQLLGNAGSSIGSTSTPWNEIFTNNISAGAVKNQTGSQLFVESTENINLALIGSNKKAKVTGIGTFQLPRMTTTQRNSLSPEVGDMIYNFDVGTVQAYVGTTGFTEEGEPIPGWVNLFQPPAET